MNRTLKELVKVLIVEDSPLMQQLLSHIFSQEHGMQVVGVADDAEGAIKAVETLQPDVVTMDIQIKRANGLDLTRQLMQSTPIPIVVISSSLRPGDTQTALEVLRAGALAAMPKPPALSHPDFGKIAANIRQTVKDMAAVKVVKRRPGSGASSLSNLSIIPKLKPLANKYQLIAIGASTGGPPAVLSLLKELSPEIALPVLLVQHIYPGFAPGLVNWLNTETPWQVKLLNSGTRAEAGVVYLCENGFQMGMKAEGIITVAGADDAHHCPSVSHLFASLAASYADRTIAIILSGMGSDGAEELKQLRDKGALTIAQDQKSSIVYGMPGEAARLNAAEYNLSPGAAARMLNQIFNKQKNEE